MMLLLILLQQNVSMWLEEDFSVLLNRTEKSAAFAVVPFIPIWTLYNFKYTNHACYHTQSGNLSELFCNFKEKFWANISKVVLAQDLIHSLNDVKRQPRAERLNKYT